METRITSKKFSISKKEMTTILGGISINIICPDCGGDDWLITTDGTYTKIICLNCAYSKLYP